MAAGATEIPAGGPPVPCELRACTALLRVEFFAELTSWVTRVPPVALLDVTAPEAVPVDVSAVFDAVSA